MNTKAFTNDTTAFTSGAAVLTYFIVVALRMWFPAILETAGEAEFVAATAAGLAIVGRQIKYYALERGKK